MLFAYYLLSILFVARIEHGNAVSDLGAPGFTCNPSLMTPSPTKPTSAHAVRPADINLVMAMGDSLTAGYCTDDVGGCHKEYRGLSFGGGGDRGLDTHITIPNIIQKFNPNVFGASHGIGGWSDYNVSYLNMAISGMRANNLPYQANNLIKTMKEHPNIDIQNDWKLLNLFIGYNDICNCGGDECYCKNQTAFSAQNYANWIRQALNTLRDNVPKLIVNLVQMCHLEQLNAMADQHCFKGHCSGCADFTQDQLSQVMVEYQQAEKQLEASGEFDTKDDFTLVVQPWYTNATLPYYSNGTFNKEFWAADCYHYSSYGHALLSTWYWKNMMQPVGSKLVNANLSVPALPLACPDTECPFIRTTKNSADCSQYGGTCTSDGGSCTTGPIADPIPRFEEDAFLMRNVRTPGNLVPSFVRIGKRIPHMPKGGMKRDGGPSFRNNYAEDPDLARYKIYLAMRHGINLRNYYKK